MKRVNTNIEEGIPDDFIDGTVMENIVQGNDNNDNGGGSDSSDSSEDNNNNNNNNNGAGEGTETKTYTQEEVLALLQKETDKRVTEALKKQQRKYEKQISLSKLDGDEREKAEKDNKIAELEEKLLEFQTERNKSELKSVLSSRGLSAEFADIIAISDDIEASQANIDKLDKLFKAAVKAEVEKRLAGAGSSPRGNGSGQSAEITKDSIKKMSLTELNELMESNPELYDKLFS